MASTLPRLPLFSHIQKHDPSSPAIIHSQSGQTFTYGQLLRDVAQSTYRLETDIAKGKDLKGERIAFLIENSYDYVVTFLAVLGARAIALPLAPSFPPSELRYILNHSQSSILLSSPTHNAKATEVLATDVEHPPTHVQISTASPSSTPSAPITLTDLPDDPSGLMLYTSGTTSRPKGVLLPTSALTAQQESLITAWNYTPADRLLHVLPLHHIHGTVNAVLTPLHAGSTIEFLPFTTETLWSRLAAPFLPSTSSSHLRKPITFLTAVPTIYSNLLSSFPKLSPEIQSAARDALAPQNLRLNISGSAALPTPTKTAWSDLSAGNVLLERYGMTEIGMALSCGLSFSSRIDGSVGWPLPGVDVRLVDTETNAVIPLGSETDEQGRERQGEIQVRGPTVFHSYWRNPDATASEFVDDEDGGGRWFKTGDVATRKHVPTVKTEESWITGPAYFIAGRLSADIIKSGGEKVSALEVEREMLSLPEVHEVAVVGVPSAKWGQKVGAVVVLSEEGQHAGKNGGPIGKLELRNELKARLVAYKCPLEYKFVESVPRNAMGKVNKKGLVGEVFADRVSPPAEGR